MQILSLDDIKSRVNLPEIIRLKEEGFQAFSNGKVVVPPVASIEMPHFPVRCHIKYGVIEGDDVFIIKYSGGRRRSQEFGESTFNGMMMVFDAKTAEPLYILQDQGYLTQLRTAIAGLVCAKYLAPKSINAIGIIGTATQARLQLEILRDLSDCRKVYVWGRTDDAVMQYKSDMEAKGYEVIIASTTAEVAKQCNLIVTTTSASEILLRSDEVQAGTHITAMGADFPGKQELDPQLFAKADIIAVDSRPQCIEHGDTCHAYSQNIISDHHLIELGAIISNPQKGRQNDQQITIADLTGVAIQDIQIAKSIVNFAP